MGKSNYNFKKLHPFKWFILENYPFLEDSIDVLTNYQLFCKLGEMINNQVAPINEMGEQVETLTDAFNSLYDWFENLDVQDEVDHKLDEMAEDGTLEEIMADYLQTKAIFGFNNVTALKEATNLRDGSFARTLGYLTPNDGGGATYRVREIINTDVIDEGSIIALNDENLVAELIIEDKVNVLNFGYTVDTITYDNNTYNIKNITTALENAISYIIRSETNKGNNGGIIGSQVYFPDDFYYINDTIDLDDHDISLIGDSAPLKRVGYNIIHVRQKIFTNVNGHVFTNGRLYIKGLNFLNIVNNNVTDYNFTNALVKNIENCYVNNYDIAINSDVSSVATITNNFFLNCKKSFIKGKVVDSVISNNYINAERDNGNVTTGIDCTVFGLSTITGNFFDFWTTTILVSSQCEEGRIINNTFDYTYRAIKVGGVTGLIISNNSFNHISKTYNGTMLHYASDSEYALNDWYGIETLYTIKNLIVESNTIENYDKFITIPNIVIDSSIICNNNNMNDFTKYGSFYKTLKAENVKILDLDKKEYLVEPTYSNTYIGQLVLYNGVYFRNIGNTIYSVGLKLLENEYLKSYTTAGEGNYSIDLSNIGNGALYNNMILEIKTTKNYYALKTALYKIFRIGGTAYALTLFDNTETDLKPSITNTGTTLNITMSGSYETGENAKQVTYRVYEQ